MQGNDNVWEARVDLSYRFTFHYEIREIENELDGEDDTLCILRNIGSHDILNKAPWILCQATWHRADQDFLPPPEMLVKRDPETEKVTIVLDKETVNFFSREGE